MSIYISTGPKYVIRSRWGIPKKLKTENVERFPSRFNVSVGVRKCPLYVIYNNHLFGLCHIKDILKTYWRR